MIIKRTRRTKLSTESDQLKGLGILYNHKVVLYDSSSIKITESISKNSVDNLNDKVILLCLLLTII